MRTLLKVAGRVCMSSLYIVAGYAAVTEPGGRVQAVDKAGLPAAEQLVRLNGVAMVAGGLGLATGVLSRAAAAGLVLSMVPTTYVGHAYWKFDDPQQRAMQRVQFLKNLGLIGALITYAAGND